MVDVEKVFKESLMRISERKVDGKGFLDTFYELFIQSSDEISEMFKNTNMQKQSQMLKKSISELVFCYSEKKINNHLLDIGKLHSKDALNISPNLYSLWLETLIKTVELFDPAFSPKIELSWNVILAPGITYMNFAYENPEVQ